MSLHITTDMMAATYELLRTTLPFRRWPLPPVAEVKLYVVRDRTASAWCRYVAKGDCYIKVSGARVGRLDRLVQLMAHEMIHLHEDMNIAKRGDIIHSATFHKLARQVCRHHGWCERDFIT